MSIDHPTLPTLEYVQQMVALTAVWQAQTESAVENPRFLVVGLGGASLSNALAARFPKSEVVSIEIEPVVVEAARGYFFYRESYLVSTVVDDARHFLENNKKPFDLIFLDAFDGVGVPPTLRTVEFAELLKQNLSPQGGVVANIHFTPREPSLRYRKALLTSFEHLYLTDGFAQGIGLFTDFPVSIRPLKERLDVWESRYSLPLEELLDGRHQESLDGVEPYRDVAP